MAPAMDEPRIWTAGLLVIGDEILSGRTQDRNVAQIGTWLNLQGIRLREVRMVPDVIETIAEATNALRGAYDYLFTTGGIGPTHDDITVDGIAHALRRPGGRACQGPRDPGGILCDARRRQRRAAADGAGAEGAELIENRFSGAPGIHVENVYILAGVPRIAAMMLDALEGSLEGGRPLLSHTLGGWIQESQVADLLAATERRTARCQIGSYPFFRDGRPGANFVIRSDDEAALAHAPPSSRRAGGARQGSGGRRGLGAPPLQPDEAVGRAALLRPDARPGPARATPPGRTPA
jgi:molybdopterin-biosynthesis enzyme MoeA-like protein